MASLPGYSLSALSSLVCCVVLGWMLRSPWERFNCGYELNIVEPIFHFNVVYDLPRQVAKTLTSFSIILQVASSSVAIVEPS